jgi:hypothetical protein
MMQSRIEAELLHHDGSPVEYRPGWQVRDWRQFCRWMARLGAVPSYHEQLIMRDVWMALRRIRE